MQQFWEPKPGAVQHEILVFWKGGNLGHLLFKNAADADAAYASRSWNHAHCATRLDRIWNRQSLGAIDWCRMHGARPYYSGELRMNHVGRGW